MGLKEKRKGEYGERVIRDMFREAFGDLIEPEDIKRGSVFQKTSDVIGLPDIHVENKFVEKLNIHAAMKQAVEESEKRKDGMPTVFFKRSREEVLVCMRFKDWKKLYRAYLNRLPFEE